VLEKPFHPAVVDRFEERPDVGVEYPIHFPINRDSEGIECPVLRSAGPIAVRETNEHRLVKWLEYHPRRLLDDLVFQSGNTNRARAAIAFRDVHSPDRLRLIAPAMDAVL